MDRVPTKITIGLCLVTLIVLGYTGIEINGAIDHLHHSHWDRHANFHAVSGLLWLLTLFAVNEVLLWRFVRLGYSWAWWLVTFIGVGVFGGAVAGDPLTSGGLRHGDTALATGEIAYWSGWASLVGWIIGMVLAKPKVWKQM